ncbi:MAG TPA: hypothetical protein GX717_08915, partial [Clostridiaceae bacterium]|nr:hypothetical protein [Clostridiaceae bacterium]
GALDQNPNTSATSLRILPRTGSGGFLILGLALLLIGGATGLSVLMIRRKRNGKENIFISLILAGGVLLSGGLISGKAAADELEDSRIVVPLKADFMMGEHAYQYRGELSFNISEFRVVEESVVREIPFAKEVVYDDALPVLKDDGSDNVFVKVQGEVGEQTTVYQAIYRGDVLIERKVLSQATTLDPINEVTVYGSQEMRRHEVIPFTTTYLAIPELEIGTANVVLVEGVEGAISDIYTRNKRTGAVDQRVEEVLPTTKQIGIPSRETIVEPIEFEIEEKEDANRLLGERETIREGIVGERTIIRHYEVASADGALSSPTEVNNEVTRKPVNQIDLIGTKVLSEDDSETTVSTTVSESADTTATTESAEVTAIPSESVPETNDSTVEQIEPTNSESAESQPTDSEPTTVPQITTTGTIPDESAGADNETPPTTVAITEPSDIANEDAGADEETATSSATDISAAVTEKVLDAEIELEDDPVETASNISEESEATVADEENAENETDYGKICRELIAEHRDEAEEVIFDAELNAKANKLVSSWAEEENDSAIPYELTDDDEFAAAWIIRLETAEDEDLTDCLRSWFDDEDNRAAIAMADWTEIGIGCKEVEGVLYLAFVE